MRGCKTALWDCKNGTSSLLKGMEGLLSRGNHTEKGVGAIKFSGSRRWVGVEGRVEGVCIFI